MELRDCPSNHGNTIRVLKTLGLYRVGCHICGKNTGFYSEKEKALAAWNESVRPERVSPTPEDIARLVEAANKVIELIDWWVEYDPELIFIQDSRVGQMRDALAPFRAGEKA